MSRVGNACGQAGGPERLDESDVEPAERIGKSVGPMYSLPPVRQGGARSAVTSPGPVTRSNAVMKASGGPVLSYRRPGRLQVGVIVGPGGHDNQPGETALRGPGGCPTGTLPGMNLLVSPMDVLRTKHDVSVFVVEVRDLHYIFKRVRLEVAICDDVFVSSRTRSSGD